MFPGGAPSTPEETRGIVNAPGPPSSFKRFDYNRDEKTPRAEAGTYKASPGYGEAEKGFFAVRFRQNASNHSVSDLSSPEGRHHSDRLVGRLTPFHSRMKIMRLRQAIQLFEN